MNSFLRNVSLFTGRESAVKEALTSQLSSSVKEIQLNQANGEGRAELLGTDDVTSSLCTVLEALFIHGLKDTFMNRVSQAIGGDIDQRPEPTFWGPLLVFSHREIIDQVNALFLVTTDVGRSRAWLRLALNDGLLSSYLGAMKREGSALKPYYHAWAFVRDSDLLDVAQRLLEGVDNYPFALACNSSLLNMWTNQPLLLAGLWTPPLGTCPVAAGIDIASTMEVSESEEILSEAHTPLSIPGSAIGCGSLNEEEALRIILGTPVSDQTPPQSIIASTSARPTNIPGMAAAAAVPAPVLQEDTASSLGNSLTGRLGWSSSFEEVEPDTENSSTNTLCPPVTSLLRSPSEVQSYHSLLENYNMSGSYVKTPDFQDFLHRYEGRLPDPVADLSEVPDVDDPCSPLYGLGYEVVPTSPTSLFAIPEFSSLVQQLGKLCNERGLDVQNYSCASCAHPVGMNFGRANLCAFTGSSYCSECHTGDEWVIPARVIHNWDFRRYTVACKSAAFLDEIQHHPLLDLKVLNPRLYLVVEEMAQLQALRIQLNLLRAYLFTCREPVIEDLQKRVWPREYLYEHVHLYSVADLLQIPSGTLAQFLIRVVAFARDHVLTCWLCSQKGFICEVCSNNKAIYPFDTDSTYRCAACSAVFHVGCLDALKPCPKCERRQRREDSPLLVGVDS